MGRIRAPRAAPPPRRRPARENAAPGGPAAKRRNGTSKAAPSSSAPKRAPLRATQASAAAKTKHSAGGAHTARSLPPPPPPAAPTTATDVDDDGEAYERARAANIARNRAAIEALRLRDLAAEVRPAPPAAQNKQQQARRRGRVWTSAKHGRRAAPTRASARARGLGPDADVPLEPYEPPQAAPRRTAAPRHRASVPAAGAKPPRAAAARAAAHGAWLFAPADFWAAVPGGNPCPDPIVSDGVYRGGLEPGVAARLARAQPGVGGGPGRGGAFTSAARAAAAAAIHTNPNAFFYRFPEPGVPQRNGPWEPEEAARFLAVARDHGVGSHWGLFASHIPGRVGYQAAAFYRDVAIPSGAVLDARFAMTVDGRAVWIGE
jgi:hypothetical protein